MLRSINFCAMLYRFSKLNNSVKTDNRAGLYQPKQIQKTTHGSLRDIVEEKKRMSIEYRKKYQQNLPSLELRIFANEHLCDVKLYMKHDDWKSQYIYAIMNYQKLGFQKLSDYSQLRETSKYFNISKKPESQKWPLVKFSIPLRQPFILHGIKQICDFLQQNQFFRQEIDDDKSLSETLQKYIDQKVAPPLQSLFWHPRLTFEQVFHTNISGSTKSNLNYKILSIISRNVIQITKQITTNLIKIIKNKQQYLKSKQNLQKSLKQVSSILQGKQFIGGKKPSHLDFYLFAILSTRRSSNHFQQFLKKDVSPEFWSWMIRMRRLTQYNKQRVTLF